MCIMWNFKECNMGKVWRLQTRTDSEDGKKDIQILFEA